MAHIYKITNLINGKIYIGKSLREEADYLGSGLQITAAVKKYGKENFSKEVIEECAEKVLDDREIFWIEHLNSRDTNIGYNISVGGTGGNHYWSSLDDSGKEELKGKISKSRLGQKTEYSEERRKNVKAGLKKFWEEKKDDTEWLIARTNPKKYILSNEIDFIRLENLGKYSKEHNLDRCWLSSMATGKKINPCKGYYCFLDKGQTNTEILQLIEILKEKKKEVEEKWLEKTRTREKYKCVHCEKLATKSNLTRWHNDNCKEWR